MLFYTVSKICITAKSILKKKKERKEKVRIIPKIENITKNTSKKYLFSSKLKPKSLEIELYEMS